MNRPAVAAALSWTAGYALVVWGIRPLSGLMFIITAAAAAACVFFGTLQKKKLWAGVSLLALLWTGNGYYHWTDGRNVSELEPPPMAESGADGFPMARVSGTLASPVEVDGDRAVFYVNAERWTWEGTPAQILEAERVYVTVRLLVREEQNKVAGWRRGDRVTLDGMAKLPELARNFGGFDFRDYLRRQHVHWTLTVKGTSGIEVAGAEGISFAGLLSGNDRFRVSVGQRLDELFPQEESGYMKGLLIGIREELDPERFREFSRLGLSHILAISGLHVAVYLWAVTTLLRRLRITREKYMLIAMCSIPFYIVFTGSSPSVIRAGATAMAGLYAAGKGWLKDGLSLLGAAALAMLVWNPYYVLDAGFQLSFLVTAGLIVGVPVVGKLIPIRNRLLNGSITVALTAQLVSFPLSVYYFNQFSVLSLPANLVLVPVISFIITPLGYAALLLSFIFPYVGGLAADFTSLLNRVIFRIVEGMDNIEWGRLIWPSPPIWWLGVYYVLIGSALYLAWRRTQLKEMERSGVLLEAEPWLKLKRLLTASAGSALLFGLLCGYGYSPYLLTEKGVGAVEFLDVGQGDSAYVRTPGGKHLLIDGGGASLFRKPGEEWKDRLDPFEVGRKTVVPLLKKRGVHKLDYILISHEDTDHIGGLAAVMEEIPVGGIIFNGTLKSSPAAESLFRTALKRKIPLIPVSLGTVLTIDRDTKLAVLYPAPAPEKLDTVVREEEQNEESVVGLLTMFGYRFLFMGDLGSSGEKDILERLGGISSSPSSPAASAAAGTGIDVLKTGHHGSKGSTSMEWLAYWKPKLSVISAGKNNLYGHPHESTLERLEEAGAVIYRTDLHGEVQFSVSPGDMKVRTKLLN